MGDKQGMRSDGATWGDEQATFFWHNHDDEHPVCEAITLAVCEFKGSEPDEISPLSDWTDTDALNALFGGKGPKKPTLVEGEISFNYEDVTVTVDTLGRIIVTNASA